MRTRRNTSNIRLNFFRFPVSDLLARPLLRSRYGKFRPPSTRFPLLPTSFPEQSRGA